MKKNRVIFIEIIFFFLFVFITIFIMPLATTQQWQQLRDCSVFEGGWTVNSASGSDSYDTLPTFYYPDDDEQDIWITKELTNISDGECIGFFSFQQQVDVLLEGEIIYSFAPSARSHSQTPGNKWNLLPINESDNGKTLTIHIHQCYMKGRVTIPTIYYGTQVGIALNYLSTANPRTYLSITTMFVSFVLLIFHLLKRDSIYINDSLKWLAFFAFFRGLWSYIESNTYSFFVPGLLLVSQVSYMCLKVAVVVYLEFLNEAFHNGKNRILHVLSICSLGDFFITCLLQFCGIIDFANTVFITHAIMLIAGVYTCANIIHTIRQYHISSSVATSRKRYSYFAMILCTLIVITTSIIDMVRYYITNSPDVARFSRVGDFFYVLLMSYALFLDFIYLLKMGQQAETIQEEASHDPMTHLNNRSAFEKDIVKGSTRQWMTRSIIVLDLNNLKLFNDRHGHDAGDIYIITAGQIIRDIFAPFGSVYRIGGDEFCVIAKNLSLDQFLVLRNSLEEQIAAKNTQNGALPMAIAAGYAAFDASMDKNLQDTMKRADAEMYRRKQGLKDS